VKRALITATVQSHVAQFHKPLMKLLREDGYEIHVAARDNLAEKNGLGLEFADCVYDVPFDRSPLSKKNIAAYRRLKEIIDSTEYEIISCNTPVGGVLTRLAAQKARKKGTRVFYTAHGFHFYKGAPLKYWLTFYPLEKLLAHKTDVLVTVAGEDYTLAQDKMKTKVCRIHGIGANTEKYKPLPQEEIAAMKEKEGLSDAYPVLLCIGELLKNKNQAAAIGALAEARKKYPRARLLLAGNGPLLPELKETVRELHVEDAVDFLGYRTDLERYINMADIILACSFREGLPMNVIESMLCAKPVVASVNRGHRELVADGQTGYLVQADDAAAFAQKVAALLESPEGYRAFCENALKRAEPYRDKNVLAELRDIYRK
jgi:glycosyltransferase EpsD